MSPSPKILPECYCDTLLVEKIGFKKPNHQLSIGQVLKTMEDKMSRMTAIGVIDYDKKITAKYYATFKTFKEENHLILKKHPERNHYLIVVNPALEKFILTAARECGIQEDEIPFSEIRLRQIAKSEKASTDKDLNRFLDRIVQRNAPGTKTMKEWITDILGEDP